MAPDYVEVIRRLAQLRTDRASGDPAPHKPLLLLVLMDWAEEARLPEVLPLTPELAFRFCSYWAVVAHRRRQRPDVRLPFHHLASDGLWRPLLPDMAPSADSRRTAFAQLSEEFLAYAGEAACRDQARRLLVAKYFQPQERIALYTMLGMPVPGDEQIAADAEGPAETARQLGRDARFRVNVVAAYDYTCALTGYRLLTIDAGSIVDAAHIHPFASSRNNDPRNGLALCKNAHWLFDQGLWTISDDYQVQAAAEHFAELSPDGRALREYNGARLRLPRDVSTWPASEHLAWHRECRFQQAL